MTNFGKMKTNRVVLAAGAAMLVVLGAAGGAGAVQATRPTVEMAPTVRTPIARLPSATGVVTVKGRVAEIFGDRFVVQDDSGRAMVAAGTDARGKVSVGETMMVQGRYDDGQLRASYLVDRSGRIAAVGPRGPRPEGPGGPGGPGPHAGPGRDGPPPPPGCAPAPGGRGTPPPPVDGASTRDGSPAPHLRAPVRTSESGTATAPAGQNMPAD